MSARHVLGKWRTGLDCHHFTTNIRSTAITQSSPKNSRTTEYFRAVLYFMQAGLHQSVHPVRIVPDVACNQLDTPIRDIWTAIGSSLVHKSSLRLG